MIEWTPSPASTPIVLTVPCPACRAPAAVACRGKKGQTLKRPHAERGRYAFRPTRKSDRLFQTLLLTEEHVAFHEWALRLARNELAQARADWEPYDRSDVADLDAARRRRGRP